MREMGVVFEEMTRKELKDGQDQGHYKGVIVAIGSIEQHLDHLPMLHDTAHCSYVAKEVALRLFPEVLVTTPLNIGMSEHHIDAGGSVSLKPETLQIVIYDICHSLQRLGFKRVLVMSGHAGNRPCLAEHVPEVAKQLGIDARFLCYWDVVPKELGDSIIETGIPSHASEYETSTALSLYGDEVRLEDLDEEHEWADLVSGEKGHRMLEASIDGVARLMREMIREA